MKMLPGQYHIVGTGNGFLHVVATFQALGLDWPEVLEYKSKIYVFECNEPMEDGMIGHYSGHAKYTENSTQ